MSKDVEVKNGEVIKVYEPNEKEISTLKHSLRILNKVQIKNILELYQIDLPASVKTGKDVNEYLLYQFTNGLLTRELFQQLRKTAFNPELDATDGFYLAFEEDLNVQEEDLIQYTQEWNKEQLNTSYIEILDYSTEKTSFLVKKKIEKFFYDRETELSTTYFDEHQIMVDVYFKKRIVYFQTRNTVKFSSVKTVIRDFIKFILNIGKFALDPPKLNQKLNFKLKEDGWTAESYDNISPNTIKLLDLFLELDNDKSSFSDFECIDITFDHEYSNQKDVKERINSQNYDGGDLLSKEEVKQLILKKRIILNIKFNIYYREIIDAKKERFVYHSILVGIENTKSYFRLYIYNTDATLKGIISQAYEDLKQVFIEHYSEGTLLNEDKIKSLLGL
ncbi:hypothetical protein [Bacillus safensis]|uniref:hypothetical protein n=1 Tax=Bacillus safensis TaxID=561879 RepID=UPI0022823922|nr:hypothetical protein [Bacillus safensis]MCY7674922.1 hypothetical protein [Bacillus safensis]MCY7697271.1 hypothetical protein [Bacillus safensis]MEC3628100.1 hypothetical protein [Bacillus safensis]